MEQRLSAPTKREGSRSPRGQSGSGESGGATAARAQMIILPEHMVFYDWSYLLIFDYMIAVKLLEKLIVHIIVSENSAGQFTITNSIMELIS